MTASCSGSSRWTCGARRRIPERSRRGPLAFRFYGGFPEYVPVAERRRRAARKLAQLRKKGHQPKPVQIEGRTITRTFWGKAWCDSLESHADLASRLPRGRTYVRNGSVID